MYNRRYKNWNNFALGLVVMALPLLAIPERLTSWAYIVLGFLIAVFSLAQVGASGTHDQPPSPPAL